MLIAIASLCIAAAVLLTPSAPARTRFPAVFPPWPGTRRSPLRWVSLTPVLGGLLAGFVTAGPGGAIAGALVAAVVRRRRAQARRTAAATAVTEQLAESLGRISDELRAGGHPATALAGVSDDGSLAREVLTPAATAAALGEDVAGAMRRTATAHPTVAEDLHRLAAAWSLAERHGVPLAELLAGARSDMRWRVRFGASVRAQLAGPRATAAVLTCLPVLGLGLGQLLGANPLQVLRSGLIGQALVVVGVGLAAAGATWSERIMSRAVPR
ncbi:type II secretion system F family protein [Pseudonocardia sp. CA-107938]|uniref:type II secretion system F family protein n=1 Tax=Pseudonocardia sp. CA-107938 TaxID=3240021 RepID=UPI003D89E4DD